MPPLQKQNLPLPLASFNLDVNSNPQLPSTNSLLSCVNARYPRNSLISKRDGYEIIQTGDVADTPFIHKWKNRVWFFSGADNDDNTDFVYWNTTTSDTNKVSSLNLMDTEKLDIYTSRRDVFAYTEAVEVGDFTAVTYVAYDGTNYSTHIETFFTDSLLTVQHTIVDSSTTTPRPGQFATDNSTFLYWYYVNDANTLQYSTINLTTGAISAASNVTSAPAASATVYDFDICVSVEATPYINIIYPTSTLQAVNILAISSATPGTIAASTTKDGGATTPEIHKVACWFAGDDSTTAEYAVFAWIEEETSVGDTLKVHAWQADASSLVELTSVGTVATIGSNASYDPQCLSGCVTELSTQKSTLFWAFTDTATSIPQVDYGTYKNNGGSPTVTDDGVYLARSLVAVKPKRFGKITGDNCLIGLYTQSWNLGVDPMTQRHLIWADLHKNIIGKSLAGTYNLNVVYGGITNLQPLGDNRIDSNTFLACGSYLTQLENAYDNTNLYSLSALKNTIAHNISGAPRLKLKPTSTEKYLYIPGSLPMECDGTNLVEQGFCTYPEPFGLTDTNSGDGSMDTGAYQYICIYEWMDAYGNIHQSTPSQLGSVSITFDSCTVVVPSCPYTNKDNVVCAIYRTEEGPGYTYYRVAAVENDRTAATITYVDKKADSEINVNKPLYSTSEVSNTQPPTVSGQNIFGNRLFYIDKDKKNTIYYTKEFLDGEGTGYNSSEFAIRVPGEEITAIQALLDYLIIFQSDQIYVTRGFGFDVAGQGRNYDTPTLVSDANGCADPQTLVSIPPGILFQGLDNNIYLLQTSLQIQTVGDPVLYWLENSTILGTAVNTVKNEVYFFTNDDYSFMYDYEQNKWSLWTVPAQLAAVNNDILYFENSDNLYNSTTGSFDDNTSDQSLTVDTGWIQASGLGGYQRIYKGQLLGFNNATSATRTLKLEIAYNYDVSFTDEFTYTLEPTHTRVVSGSSTAMTSAFTYDQYVNPSGSYPDATNRDEAMILDFIPSRQKCTSMRLRITDYADATASNIASDGYSLTGMNLTVGIKKPPYPAGPHRRSS